MKKHLKYILISLLLALLGACGDDKNAGDNNATDGNATASAEETWGDKFANAASATGEACSNGWTATMEFFTPDSKEEKLTALVGLLHEDGKHFVAKRNKAADSLKPAEAEWVKTYLTWEHVSMKYVAELDKLLTEDEISDLVDFYDSDTGRTWVIKQPKVFAALQEQIDADVLRILDIMPKQRQPVDFPVKEDESRTQESVEPTAS
jgi:hypothetical protein